MNKLFLLPIVALVAVMAVSLVNASSCCTCGDSTNGYRCALYISINDCTTLPGGFCEGYHRGTWISDGHIVYDTSVTPNTCDCVPEFTSAGIGLAMSGAGIGFALLRRKFRK